MYLACLQCSLFTTKSVYPLADILRNTYREKVRSGKRCTAVNRFVFSWQTLAESQQARQVPVQRGTLRAYLQTIPRLVRGGKTVPMRVTINATLLNSNSSQSVFAGQHHINVTSASNGWVDLNITRGIQELWPPRAEEHVVELTLTLSVGCKHHKKVPATFVNPAEIPLKNAKRRERHRFLQPMLLVHLSDTQVKEMVKNGGQQALPGGEDEIVLSEGDTQSERKKRSAGNDFCAIEDFTVNFHDLQLYYVLVPHSYNAKRCAGSCSHTMLTRRGQAGTNHAKIMASAKAVSQAYPSVTFRHPPRDPCCIPTKYKSLSLLVTRGEGIIELEVYPAMIVEECGCR